MSDEEMKDVWRNADDGDRINLNVPQLLVNLKAKMKTMDRKLFFRDAGEIVAAIVIMIFFGYQSIIESIPLTKITNVLIVVWSIYVIYKLLGVRKYKKVAELSSTLKAQLAQQKMYLQKQAHLLDTVLWWYIAPPAVLAMTAIIGRSFALGFNWKNILFNFFVISSIGGVIYALNKRAAKTTYQPLIDKIDTLMLQLDEDVIL